MTACRDIVFIVTDAQRFDLLGVTGIEERFARLLKACIVPKLIRRRPPSNPMTCLYPGKD
jgi:hypothetical protein